MSVFRVITRIIPLNANETSYEPASFDLLTGGNSKLINVLNMTEPKSGLSYRIERIEDIQNIGPGETVESVNRAFAEKLKNIPGFVPLKENDEQSGLSDKSFQLSLPQVISLGKDASSNDSNSFTISVVENSTNPTKKSEVPKKHNKGSKRKNRISGVTQSANDKDESKKIRLASDNVDSNFNKKESRKKQVIDDAKSSNEKKESKKKQVIDDTESLNEKKESRKKQVIDDTEYSNEKKEFKKKQAVDDTESSNEKEEFKKKQAVDDTESSNEKKESKKKQVIDDTESSNEKKESTKKQKAGNVTGSSSDKKNPKSKVFDDFESSNDKKESEKEQKSIDINVANDKKVLKNEHIASDIESFSDKKEYGADNGNDSFIDKKESMNKRRASDVSGCSNEKNKSKKKRRASDISGSLNDMKESKKKHITSDNTGPLNDKETKKKWIASDDTDAFSLNEKCKTADDTPALDTLPESESLTVKKSLKMKYKLGKKIKILYKSQIPPETKPNENIESTNVSTILSRDIENDKDSDTEPATEKLSEEEELASLNKSETKCDNDKIKSTNKDKNASLDDSSYDTGCGDLVINMFETMDSNSSSLQIDSSNNKCDNLNDVITSDSDLSSSAHLKGNSSSIEIAAGEDSSHMPESTSFDSSTLETISTEFTVSAEHPFFDLLQPLKKYFVSGECLICGYIPDEVDYNAAEHMETHISSNSSFCYYKCICCTEKFCSPRNLYMHALSREKSYKYMCDICLLKFKRKHYLLRHNAKSHSSARDGAI